jgi:hypothetical protein
MDMPALGTAIVAAFVIMRLTEAIIKPLWLRLNLDAFWLLYATLAIGAALGWFTGLNGFPLFPVSPLLGRLLTCLVIGLGPSFIYDLVDKKPTLPANNTPSYYEHG